MSLAHLQICTAAQESEDISNCIGTQLELNSCAANIYKIHDEELNKLYLEQMSHLQSAVTKERLKDAQRVWITYRDKSCLYEVGRREESGSIWPFAYEACMDYFTRQRIGDLKQYVECTEGGCPQ